MGAAAPAGGDAVTFDSVLAAARPVVKSIALCLDGELMNELSRLDEQLRRARLADEMENRPAQAPALAAQIVDLTEKARAQELTFSFRNIGRRAWHDLLALHPPTDKDQKAGADFNTDTFPVAAMAASCVAPTGATQEAFQRLGEVTLTQEQWNALWLTCHEANVGGADIPLSAAAYAIARGIATSSAQRGSTEPAEASS